MGHGRSLPTTLLRENFDKICGAADVHQGLGPAMAYFETAEETPRRYVYVSFGMNGIRPEGSPTASADTVAQVVSASVGTFRDWLKPHRTLVWREKPLIELSPDGKRWASWWRCVQLDANVKELNIRWCF